MPPIRLPAQSAASSQSLFGSLIFDPDPKLLELPAHLLAELLEILTQLLARTLHQVCARQTAFRRAPAGARRSWFFFLFFGCQLDPSPNAFSGK
jgi:hypothetical protein